ncbi:MAG: GFA family protein [Paracoccaceae bacterium]|nr:GFA family protein [Paracoccaceae bacterium]
MSKVTGQCLCGAVTVTAEPARPSLSVCHCDMCRRWSSSAFMAIEARPGSVTVEGPAKTITTSDWAERAFCPECGSPLWYRITAEGPMHSQMQVAAGLFDNAAGGTLKLEVYVDRQPAGYHFAEATKRLTEAELLAAMGITPEGGA